MHISFRRSSIVFLEQANSGYCPVSTLIQHRAIFELDFSMRYDLCYLYTRQMQTFLLSQMILMKQ